MGIFKNFLKYFSPLTVRVFENRINFERKLFNNILSEVKNANNNYNKMLNRQTLIDNKVSDVKKTLKEVLWAEIFNNTIVDSNWLDNKKFSPGRWAAGYPLLYSLYRILDEIRPQSILELGLGQTTKMIAQYVKNSDVEKHIVVEHDSDWINYFMKNFELSNKTHIEKMDLITTEYSEDKDVISYKDFADKLKHKKFDLIVVDGPFGGYAKIYSRIDILGILPNCLKDDFVIILDDLNRQGERMTLKKIIENLEQNNIKYKRGQYSGEKDVVIIVSEKLGFLCTM